MPHALAVDDDPNFLNALAELIEGQGFTTNTATTLRDARERLLHTRPDIALIDLRLPDGSGMDLLRELERTNTTEVIVITGHADVDSAIEALRVGATDYLTKPLDIARLKEILAKVAREDLSLPDAKSPVQEAREQKRLGLLLGASPAMFELYEQMTRVARTDATVFFIGDSGTGKDLASQTLHALSRRRDEPFLPLNCGAITPTLIESELFGHERGSFTGAAKRHKGYFERAHGGTLFLDEITEMPFELQVKLLRVLETGALVRIGGDQPVEVDVRVVAATNRDPDKAVEEGKMREDLLYRLSVFPVHMPPLRERGEDIDLLADFFLDTLNEQYEAEKELGDEARELFHVHPWPGNVRELKNVMHRAWIMAEEVIDCACLPPRMRGLADGHRQVAFSVGTSISDAERRLILATLEHHGGNKKKTADVLGVSLKTLYNRLNAYKEDGSEAEIETEEDEGDGDEYSTRLSPRSACRVRQLVESEPTSPTAAAHAAPPACRHRLDGGQRLLDALAMRLQPGRQLERRPQLGGGLVEAEAVADRWRSRTARRPAHGSRSSGSTGGRGPAWTAGRAKRSSRQAAGRRHRQRGTPRGGPCRRRRGRHRRADRSPGPPARPAASRRPPNAGAARPPPRRASPSRRADPPSRRRRPAAGSPSAGRAPRGARAPYRRSTAPPRCWPRRQPARAQAVRVEQRQHLVAETPLGLTLRRVAAAHVAHHHAHAAQAVAPPTQRAGRHRQRRRRHLAGTAAAAARQGPGKEGEDAPRPAGGVAEVEVVGPGIVEVHRPLDQPQPQRPGVEVDVALRIGGDGRDVMDAADGPAHGSSLPWRPFDRCNEHQADDIPPSGDSSSS